MVAALCFSANAQEGAPILMNAVHFKVQKNLSEFIVDQPAKSEIFNGRYYRLIQFDNIPLQNQKNEMVSAGVRFLNYIPEKAYIVSFPSDFDRNILKNYGVRAAYEVPAEVKLNHMLYNKQYPAWAMKGSSTIELNIKLHEDVDNFEDIKSYLESKGLEISWSYAFSKLIRVTTDLKNINKLIKYPFVAHVEPIDPPAEPENYTATTDHRSNILASSYAGGRKYNGAGVLVAVGDDGSIDHIDFEGRTDQTKVTSSPGGQHGDHVAGIVAGAGNLDPKARGNGWGAFMYIYDPFQNIYDAVNTYSTPGIRITSTSYSNGCNAGYTTFAQTCDQHINTYRSLNHVFSAGNNGTSDCSYGAGAGWGNVTGGNKIAKNVITVASLDKADGLASYSSRGPAHDGRIKPDIGAVGSSVYSCMGPNTYRVISGTSMACPGISGVLSQLYQGFRANNSNNDPASGLIKAILLNTADDMGNPGPDYKNGWGRVNARRAIELIEAKNFMTDTVAQSGSNNHTLTVPAGTAQLRVMVYWTDPAATVNTSKALVNDLDIKVTTPSSSTVLPWRLDPTPIAANLNAPATRARDSLNNMEQVTIDNPAAGTYTLNVSGFSVPSGPQEYFVVYEYVKPDLTVIYPNGGEGIVPGETERIRWDYYGTAGTFKLEYSTDNGSSWNTISSSVASNLRYYDWVVPSIVTGQALIRISRGTTTDMSNANYSIIDVPANLKVDWACPDSIGLSWNSVSGATSYQVHMLGAKYMDSIGVSNTTAFVVKNINGAADYWFSVKSLGPNKCEGRRAIAIYKAQGTFNCVIPNDIQLALVNSPVEASYPGCNPTSPLAVDIDIYNNTGSTVTSVPVKYRVNGGSVVSETYTGSLAAGATATYTFNTPATISGAGSYNFEIWTDYPSDGVHSNDTGLVTVTVRNSTAVVPPYSEDFETFTACSTNSDCESTNCTMKNDWFNKQNLLEDDIDWRTNSGATPSSGTGPTMDYNPGTPTGKYLYLEASGTPVCSTKVALLVSPCFDLTMANSAMFSFRYHMSGTSMGSLHIDVKDSTGWNNDVISAINGNQGSSWNLGSVNLSAYLGQVVNIRFRGVTGINYTSDMAIDDINLAFAVGNEQSDLSSRVMIYPNPSQGQFNYVIGLTDRTDVNIEVFDLQGRLVASKQLVGVNGNVNGQMNLHHLSQGMYQVRVRQANGQMFTDQLIISK